ncbi:MAG: cation transporter [Chlorobi bacterium]|nr:cation transporter [Chlorobiota bacterium]
MIERIIEWSANNRLMVILFFLLIAGAGVWAVITTPVDAIPDLSENQVIIFSEWMGRSPKIIEDQVTYPIVTTLQGLPDVKAVRANSMFGMSFVFVIFNDNVDLYFARTRVQERLGAAQAKLPAGVTATLGPDGTGVGHIFWYTVEGGGYDLGALRSVQDWFIRYKLASVDGVAEVASIGGFVRQYQIDVNPELMRSYGVTFDEIIAAVQLSNNEVGGKLLDVAGAEFFVRGEGYIGGRGDIERITVATRNGGLPIRLDQIATVQLGGEIRRGSLEKNGNGEAVGGIIVMRQGENAATVIERVKAKIAEISPGLPRGVKIVPSYDRTPLIRAAVGTLERTLVEEAIIVTLVVLLFIFHVRSALRILIEIPVSVLCAFLLMRLSGMASNIMSLGGIALAIGVVVDSSIVLVENAHRNIAEAQRENAHLTRDDYFRLAVLSARQVGRAIFFSEAIMVISFLPVFLLQGEEGKLFHPLAWTKTFVIASSAIAGITLVPMLMTLLMRGTFRPENRNPVMRFFHRLYEPVLSWCLRWRKTTVALNLLALVATIPLILSTGSEFMPSLDEGSVLFMPILLPNASMAEVNRVMKVQDSIIARYPEVDHVLGKAGRAETATDNAPVSMIETIVLLKPREQWRPGITKSTITADLDRELQIPGVRNGWTQPIINRVNMLSTGVRTELGVKIYGDNLDSLEAYAIRAESLLNNIPGAADVAADRIQGGSFLDITVDRDASARYGLAIGDVQRLIETAIGGENIAQVISGRERYPIRVRYSRELRDNVEDLRNILVPIGRSAPAPSAPAGMPGSAGDASMNGGGTNSGAMSGGTMSSGNGDRARGAVTGSGSSISALAGASAEAFLRLGEVAKITLAPGPAMISSENGQLRSVVFLNVRGRDMGSFIDEARKTLDGRLALPAGYTYEWSGQYENKARAERTLAIVIPIVFMVIFLMLYLTMHDWKEAGVVMLSVPFALIGGVYLMSILGYNFSVAVWVGFIALYGIAVQTGVVMVVYLHQSLDRTLAETGAVTRDDLHAATMRGAVQRLRPKLMTVCTALLGLVPIMFSTGVGSDMMKPLIAPMIGGLFTSAIHVLIMTPVLFIIMKERALKRGELRKSKMAEWMG